LVSQRDPVDLAPIVEGGTVSGALHNSLDLAQHAERWGYRRFWLAEHHNARGIASAATAVVIAHVAAGTQTIRVGARGIMLPNHAPLVIAEQFGTLAALHQGRIDFGLGRVSFGIRNVAGQGFDLSDVDLGSSWRIALGQCAMHYQIGIASDRTGEMEVVRLG